MNFSFQRKKGGNCLDTKETMEVVNKTFMAIFGQTSSYTLEEVLSEFAFDVRLPQRVIDSVTGEETWASGRRNLGICGKFCKIYYTRKHEKI